MKPAWCSSAFACWTASRWFYLLQSTWCTELWKQNKTNKRVLQWTAIWNIYFGIWWNLWHNRLPAIPDHLRVMKKC